MPETAVDRAGDSRADGEILSWVAQALRSLVKTDLCVAYASARGRTVHVLTPRILGRGDLQQVLSALASLEAIQPGQWETVLVNHREPTDLPEAVHPSLRRVMPIPLSVAGRKIGALVVATWDELPGPRSFSALRRIATEVGTALQSLWAAVAKERDKLEAVLHNLIDGVLLVDRRGEILCANQVGVRLAGLRRRGATWSFPDGDSSVPIRAYLQEAQEAQLWEFNRIWRSEETPRLVLGIKGRRIRDAENRDWGWLLQIRDITQSWQAERFRNDVLSIAAHEIHTPLTSMNDAVSLLLEDKLGSLNAKQRHLLELLQHDIRRLSGLVEQLLDVGRYDSSAYPVERRHKVDVVRTLQSAVDHIQHRACRKGLSLVTVLSEDIPPVLGDRDKLLQVVQNLLDNAVKFTPLGGLVEVGARQEGAEVLVWVRDTGIGIAEEYHEWIFEKFARLHRDPDEEEDEAKGYGLGLSIAKSIVESWGGRIWVESRVGEGSTFRFTIPLARQTGSALAASSGDAEGAGQGE
ncbi:MAG: PAS domain-containing sensor histidine kinase [candidate division KSB1 bacterium]|nr:PAS domain-containing sensor histidine kinase [candidate division KSB1 bacterium]